MPKERRCLKPYTWTNRADTNDGDIVTVGCELKNTEKKQYVFVSDKHKRLRPRVESRVIAKENHRLSCEVCEGKILCNRRSLKKD